MARRSSLSEDQRFMKLELQEFAECLITTYCNSAALNENSWPFTIPTIIGAGLSASARVPIDYKLRQEISEKLSPDTPILSYEKIYKLINSGSELNATNLLPSKIDFRNLLSRAGIPRDVEGGVAPNLSNFAVISLLKSSFLGPIVSLNVDPLLLRASKYIDSDQTGGIKFVSNISQISHFLDDQTDHSERQKTVLQIHGSIEEPESLRFTKDELASNNLDIIRAATIGCAKSDILFCIGTSLNDGVTEKIVERWAIDRLNMQRQPIFYVSFFKNAPLKRLAKIIDSVENKIKPDFKNKFKIKYLQNSNSDNLFEKIVQFGLSETKRRRGRKSQSTIKINSIASSSIRSKIYSKRLSESFTVLPPTKVRIAIELIVHAIASRGPFTIRDATRSSPELFSVGFSSRFEHGLELKAVLEKLTNSQLFAFARNSENGWNVSFEASAPKSVDEIEQQLLIKNPTIKKPDAFAERVIDFLDDMGHRTTASKSELASAFLELEIEGLESFQIRQSLPAAACFDRPNIITSRRDLESKLSKFKDEFSELAKEPERRSDCYIVSETGEHLFLANEIEKHHEWDVENRPENVGQYLVEWLKPILNADFRNVSVHLFLAAADPENLVTQSLFEVSIENTASRRRVAHNVSILIKELATLPNFNVSYVPWEDHIDHMWYYRSQKDRQQEQKGIYYPTRYYEQLHYGLEVEGKQNVDVLEEIRSTLFGTKSFPRNEIPKSFVLALTIVDNKNGDALERLQDKSVLVCVRSPQTNNDHKNVASVPTMRISKSSYDKICSQAVWAINAEDEKLACRGYLYDQDSFVSSEGASGENSLRDAIDGLLSRKFALGDALERGDFVYKAKPAIVRVGNSEVIAPTDSGELLAMVNALVLVDKGADMLEKINKTASYKNISFIPIPEFEAALCTSDRVINFADGQYQYGGLCVCTASGLLHLRVQEF